LAVATSAQAMSQTTAINLIILSSYVNLLKKSVSLI